jgi:hypothetical protein
MRDDRLDAWVSGRDAARILTENSGHMVSPAYVRWLGNHEKVRTRIFDGRTKLYYKADIMGYTVDTKRGPKPRSAREAA